jgi:peroxiredoxin
MELGKTLGWIPKRVTFVVDEMGFIQYIFNSQFAVKKHVSRVLAFLKTTSNKSQTE